MGSYAWATGQYHWREGIVQVFYSGVKVPLLLFATLLVSLPSFYVFNSLLGLRNDLRESIRNIIVSQATLAITLCSLAPLTMLWYASVSTTDSSYAASIMLNAIFFAIASFTSQAALRYRYRTLIQRDPMHRWMLWTWLILFALVGIQMGWIMRPFIGNPNQSPAFLRPGAWDNAYVNVLNIISRIFS